MGVKVGITDGFGVGVDVGIIITLVGVGCGKVPPQALFTLGK